MNTERFLRPIDLARRWGVSRQYVTKIIRAGKIILNADRLIDTEDPVNAATIAERTTPKDSKRVSSVKPKKAKPAEKTTNRYEAQAADIPEGFVSRSEWEARKIQLQAQKLQLEIDERKAALLPTEIVAAAIGGIHRGIIANFIDAPQRWAIQICQMLGAEGREREITEYLEKDVHRGLLAVDQSARSALNKLRRGSAGKEKRNEGDNGSTGEN